MTEWHERDEVLECRYNGLICRVCGEKHCMNPDRYQSSDHHCTEQNCPRDEIKDKRNDYRSNKIRTK
jgi:hypothetical protein